MPVFRPRLARWVCAVGGIVLAVGTVVFLGLIADVGPLSFSWRDTLGLLVLVAGAEWLLARLGGVRATPDSTGLVVRNIVRTRRVDWAEILLVRMGPGDPWVQLDLADATTLAVMAIQSADGERGPAEAVRLATLVEERSEPPGPG